MSQSVDPKHNGFLYICMDASKPTECKIGMTTRSLYDRITETGNPDYMIVKAYAVPPSEARMLEKHIHKEIDKSFVRKRHLITGKSSEWFCCSPDQAADALEHTLAKCLNLQDEDGMPQLKGIIFKPDMGDGNQIQMGWRASEPEHVENILKAVEKSH